MWKRSNQDDEGGGRDNCVTHISLFLGFIYRLCTGGLYDTWRWENGVWRCTREHRRQRIQRLPIYTTFLAHVQLVLLAESLTVLSAVVFREFK